MNVQLSSANGGVASKRIGASLEKNDLCLTVR